MLHFIIIIISLWCCLLVQKWRLSVQGSHWNWHRGRSSEARDQSLLFLSFLTVFLSLSFILSCGSSSSLIGAVQSADSPFMADGGRGRGCWNAGTFQSGQQFFITAFLAQSCCRGSRGKGVFKAGRSWISFLPSSFPLAFSYLSVWPGHRRYQGRWSLT